MNYFAQAANDRWIGLYLRFLSAVFAYGASVHLANIAGLGDGPWFDTPLSWRIGDIVYGILDITAVIGLWQQKGWGLAIALLGLFSQIGLYTLFIDAFAFTSEQRAIIYSLLRTEGLLLLILAILWITWEVRKRQETIHLQTPSE